MRKFGYVLIVLGLVLLMVPNRIMFSTVRPNVRIETIPPNALVVIKQRDKVVAWGWAPLELFLGYGGGRIYSVSAYKAVGTDEGTRIYGKTVWINPTAYKQTYHLELEVMLGLGSSKEQEILRMLSDPDAYFAEKSREQGMDNPELDYEDLPPEPTTETLETPTETSDESVESTYDLTMWLPLGLIAVGGLLAFKSRKSAG